MLAPNAFKGSFDAVQLAEAWRGALAAVPGVEPIARPMSDGGDGFVAVVSHYRPRVLAVAARVSDPLGRAVDAVWGWDPSGRAAYIESAAAIGLRHVQPGERRPLEADSTGLGQLLLSATGLGVRRVVIGLGGSATVDGGLGMARALGFRFADRRGRPVERPEDLALLARIESPKAPRADVRVTALADVASPLLGPAGAAAVFGPQKGTGPMDVERLEEGLARIAARWSADLGAPADLADRAGAGAAGGLGAACVAFLGARLVPGAAWCARLAGLSAALRDADAALTGEGRFDAQSTAGKATGYVLDRARDAGIPAAVLCAEFAGPASPAGASAAGAPLILDGASDLQRMGSLARTAVERLWARPRDDDIPLCAPYV